MTIRRQIALLLALVGLVGCTEHDEDRAIEGVLKDARRAVLAGDGQRACALLTRHGRQEARAFGTGSCEEVLRARLAAARGDPRSRWPDDLRDATFEVLSAGDGQARAELRVQDVFGTAIRWRIQLRKTSAGWRIDDSNAVPSAE